MDLQNRQDEDHASGEDGSSIERALSDREIVQSAYSDESCLDGCWQAETSFPLHWTLYLSKEPCAYIVLEWNEGYPVTSPLQVSSYRCADDYKRLERTVQFVRATASHHFKEGGIEAGLACCAAALESWNQKEDEIEAIERVNDVNGTMEPLLLESNGFVYRWMTGVYTVQDRKSLFVAHVCPVQVESDISPALQQLLNSSSKMQRATHHMYAYRLTEERVVMDKRSPSETTTVSILKHDNDDDGEDGAGARLAQLLQMRQEMNVLIVVSRWFGGIHLGARRFAHITSVAQAVLSEFHGESQRSKFKN